MSEDPVEPLNYRLKLEKKASQLARETLQREPRVEIRDFLS
jgi:hypothetical protein